MSKINIKNENVFVVFTIAAMLAMAAISATPILPTRLLYAQEDSQELAAELSGEAEVPLLRLRLLEMQLLSSIQQATK